MLREIEKRRGGTTASPGAPACLGAPCAVAGNQAARAQARGDALKPRDGGARGGETSVESESRSGMRERRPERRTEASVRGETMASSKGVVGLEVGHGAGFGRRVQRSHGLPPAPLTSSVWTSCPASSQRCPCGCDAPAHAPRSPALSSSSFSSASAVGSSSGFAASGTCLASSASDCPAEPPAQDSEPCTASSRSSSASSASASASPRFHSFPLSSSSVSFVLHTGGLSARAAHFQECAVHGAPVFDGNSAALLRSRDENALLSQSPPPSSASAPPGAPARPSSAGETDPATSVSQPPAPGGGSQAKWQFARVKTVSFANLSECGSSHGSPTTTSTGTPTAAAPRRRRLPPRSSGGAIRAVPRRPLWLRPARAGAQAARAQGPSLRRPPATSAAAAGATRVGGAGAATRAPAAARGRVCRTEPARGAAAGAGAGAAAGACRRPSSAAAPRPRSWGETPRWSVAIGGVAGVAGVVSSLRAAAGGSWAHFRGTAVSAGGGAGPARPGGGGRTTAARAAASGRRWGSARRAATT
ncbi:putative histone lysine methyltransferase, SET [Besnoitia besnoiti]|uniref:Putative histone lysine methyltransferase, SET n=1 Tax=Besnoitia besnoiti TaxID=94643 RepID=A0A2A9M816_BESBE|nr:putative histone lysine methyltransferase, SET [Besnoitia besnoiti]PFH34628.1 putative histone lysine methyltransferase, SET [Besnoitia besnoiti]